MQEFYHGIIAMLIYVALMVTIALSARAIFRIPKEVFRKMLHMIAMCFIFVFVFCYETWWIAALTSLLIAIAVYPLLALGEKYIDYSSLLIQRKTGEIKTSLVIVFTMFAIVISVCWGLLGDRMMALASVCAWGFGDAAAALMGKKFGRHKLEIKKLGVKKSWEGTLSMFVVSFICVTASLSLHGGFSPAGLILTSAITAAFTALAELLTTGGNDTITCPLTAMVSLIIMTSLIGGGF